MRKLFLLATAALLVSGATFAENGKDKKKGKKGAKTECTRSGKSCGKTKTEAAMDFVVFKNN